MIDFFRVCLTSFTAFNFPVAPMIQVKTQIIYADIGSTATFQCEVRISELFKRYLLSDEITIQNIS
jgi:hypothetical protein